jgi:hypothetical protein
MNSDLEKILSELDKELIAINDEFLDKYFEWYEENIVGKEFKSITTTTLIIKNKVNQLLKEFGYDDKVAKAIGSSCYIGTGKGLEVGQMEFIVGRTEYEDYFLNKPYFGRSLSPRIHSAARDLRRKITAFTREQIQLNTSYKAFKKELLSINASDRAKLPKVYRQLESVIDKLGIESEEVKKLLSIAKTQSSKLKIDTTEVGDLKRAYEKVQGAIAKGDSDLFKKRLEKAKAKKIHYKNLSIARSEMQRAYDEGLNRAMQENDEIWGYKIVLSPSHPKPDICDVYTKIDFGYGPGVYPKSQVIQLPIHTNCICDKVVLYSKPKGSKFEYNRDVVKKWLSKQPRRDRQDILGVGLEANKNKWDLALTRKKIVAPVALGDTKKILKKFTRPVELDNSIESKG